MSCKRIVFQSTYDNLCDKILIEEFNDKITFCSCVSHECGVHFQGNAIRNYIALVLIIQIMSLE